MSKTSGMTVTDAISRGVPPQPARRATVPRLVVALAGLIGLTAAGLAGLIMAVGFWLRRQPTVAGFGTPEPVPGSGGARGDASGDPAAIRSVATALRGPVPDPERPPSRPVDPRAPRPPRDDGLPPAAGPPEAPRSVADAAGRRPGASMLSEARPGPTGRRPARPTLRREMAAPWGANSSPGSGSPMTPAATAATAWGRSITRPRAWTATTRAEPGGAGPPTGTSSSPPASATSVSPTGPVIILVATGSGVKTDSTWWRRTRLADLVRVHPGFRDARSTVLHRFGVDPDYSRWRATFRSQSRTGPHRSRRSRPAAPDLGVHVAVPRLATISPATRAPIPPADRQCRP